MSNSILPAAGNLDIVNAKVRADKFEATTSIGVSNTNPDFDLSVGTRFHVDKDSVDPVSVTGNVVASGIKISNLTISPAFDFASVSNVGNVTANVIQFANATTGFTTTANVEIGGNITLTSNAQVKVGSNVLAEYTGPHGRDPTTPLLKKFPEIAFEEGKFDKNDTTNTYVQAGYTVTVSGFVNSSNHPWKAFNGTDYEVGMLLSGLNYDTNGNANTSGTTASRLSASDSTPYGEWLKLELPNKIKLDKYVFTSRNNATYWTQSVEAGQVWGSNNDSNWVHLHTFTNSGFTGESQSASFNVQTDNYYKYYAFIVTKTFATGSDYYLCIPELKYYGYEEPAPPGDLSLDTTLKSTFNSVRSNNYVMYFDGEDPAAGNVPKYLPSGSVKSITPNNVVFDATNNCWTLNGSTESNVTTGSLGFEGDVPHTVSTWINASNLEAKQLFSIGSGYDKSFLKVDDTQIAANTWHNVTYAYQGEGGSKVTYVDGRKVEEAQVEDTFGAYPPIAMTGYKTGGYCVSASSVYAPSPDYPAWEAFDHDTTTSGNQWLCGQGFYENNGTYTGTTSTVESSNTWTGEYLQLELPYRIRVSDVQILRELGDTYGTSRSPNTGAILGSNDGYNWSCILNFTNKPHTDYSGTVFTSLGTSSGTDSYKYLRLVVTKIQDESVTSNSNGNLLSITELKYYGHKEGDLTRFPEPTRVLKYPHIAMTGPAQRGYVVSRSTGYLNYPGWYAFGGSANWTTENNYSLSGGSSAYNPSAANVSSDDSIVAGGNTYQGDWIQLQLPHGVKFTSFKVSVPPSSEHASIHNRGIKNGILAGSNNGSSWDVLKIIGSGHVSTGSGLTWVADETKTITIDTNTTTAYKYIRLLATAVLGGTVGTYWSIPGSGLEFYGTEEDTGTPAIVGGPFAGKVANFRVYDQYLGDERIQEIYDAQKDEFGHKKSSMTFYKGRIGVGTTEPEGALTVIDEPHALQKFPARAVSADDSYVEGDGQIKLSAADGSGYQAFDGLTSTSWDSAPTRHTRVSEEVDFGAWLKIQTPESVSLKKAEFESNPDWRQVGSDINGSALNDQLGRAVACSHDGTRIIAGGHAHNGNAKGMARVYDWNGTTWELIGNQTLTGTADLDKFGSYVAISGDGNIIAVAAPFEHHQVGNVADVGTVRVYYLVGGQWTILPDSGTLTADPASGMSDVFVGSAVNSYLGNGTIQLSYDGKTIAMCEYGYDISGKNDVGRVLVYKYSNGAWSYKGTGATQFVGDTADAHFGFGMSMSEDGDHLALGTRDGGYFVEVYKWDATSSTWGIKDARISESGLNGNDDYGTAISISNDGNTLAVGARNADLADGARGAQSGLVFVYHWTGSAWGTPHKLQYNESTDEDFGISVELSGDGKRLIVAASAENSSSGELFTFEYTGTSWIMRTANVIGVSGGTSGHLGYGPDGDAHAVAISRDGSTIVGGELGYNSGFTNSGRVRVWNMPSTIKSIWGSNDDVNWTKITTAHTREEATSNVAGLAFGYDDRLEFKNLDNPNYYKYHAIVADAFTQLKDVKLFGVRNQGSSTLHDGALTLTKNLDVPRIGPPLDADDTPRRDRLVVEYNTSTNPVEDGVVRDTSGRGFDGCLKGGAYYDATEKALKFDGTGDYTEVQLPRHQVKGDWIHSVSCWVKGNVINGEEAVWNIGDRTGNPSGVQASTSTLSFNSASPTLRWYFYSNDGSTNLYTINEGDWNHIVCVYYGGGHTGTNSLVYINGNKVLLNSFTASAPLLFDETRERVLMLGRLAWGTNSDLNGSISNFKLYDVALTPEEAKTLYDMGRTGSVANPQPLHIAANLDVRGDIYGGMPVFFDVRFTSAPTATYAGSRIVFDTINNSRGGGFDNTSGTFTAPIAGQYKFSYFMRGNIVNQGIKIKPRINGSPTFNTTNDGTNQNLLGTAFCGNDGLSGSAVCIVSLEVGGTFDLHACSHGSTVTSSLANFYNGFTGEYISSL